LTLNNGVTMPALGLGVFQRPPEETTAAVEAALRDGDRHIDTAAAYGNEREVGDAVRASGLDLSSVPSIMVDHLTRLLVHASVDIPEA
jgi:diketogulonate reductase-like aldo/keto reductase